MARPELPAPGTDLSVLALARLLRRRGETRQAAELLDTTLSQGALQAPATTTLSAQVGWLNLERGDLYQDQGALQDADRHALAAVAHFERAGHRGGQAAAALQLGDLAWQAGNAEVATAWWRRCHALADNVGNPMLSARALASLALLELSRAAPEAAEALLAAAEQRAQLDLDETLDGEVLSAETRALRDEAAREQRVVAATVALVRARQAVRSGNWAETRLLIASAAEVAEAEAAWGLYVDALRLDAVVARRQGDPRSAVEALAMAARAAREGGLQRLAAVVDSERVLALADNEQWAEAFSLQAETPPDAIAEQPAVHAARLEAFAVLSLRAGNTIAAEASAREAESLRTQVTDTAGAARAAALVADTALHAGELSAALDAAARAQALAAQAGRPDVEVAARLTALAARVRGGTPSDAPSPGDTVRAPAPTEPASSTLSATGTDAGADRAAPPGSAAAWVREADALCTLADAAGSVPQRIAARDLCAATRARTGDSEGALSAAREAVQLSESHPLLRWRGRAQARLATALLAVGDAEAALRAAETAAQLGGEADDGASRARSLVAGGRALMALGRLDEAQLALGQATQEAATLKQPALAAEAALAQGEAFLRLRRPREARHVFAQAVDQARRAGSLPLQINALRGAANAAIQGGQAEIAAQELREAAALAEAAEGSDGLDTAAACRGDLARLACQQGQPDAALATLDSAPAPTSRHVRGELATVRGQALAMQRRFERAAEALEGAVADLRSERGRSLGAALFLLGQVRGYLGQGEACGAALGEALVLTASLGLPEQHEVRRVIERLQVQADGAHG